MEFSAPGMTQSKFERSPALNHYSDELFYSAGASGPAGTGGFGDDSEFCIGYEQTTLHEEEISSGVVERQRCLDVYCKYECC